MNQYYEYHEKFLLKDEIKYLKSKLKHIPWKETATKHTWVSGGFETIINPHPDWVLPLLQYISSTFKTEFNYILYSKYNSLNHTCKSTTTSEFYLGETPIAPLLGIGNSIQLELTNKYTNEEKIFCFKNNDLFLITPQHKNEWSLTIPNGNLLVEPHYSLSFRKVIHSDGDKSYYRL